LYNYTSVPELAESLDHDPTRVWAPEELLAIAFKRAPLFAPGKEYGYCNTNYTLLGLIVEKLEGAPLAKVLQDRLFGPLGMKRTLLPANTSNAIPEPYSHGYLYGSSSYALVDAPYPADLQAAAKAGTLKPNDDMAQKQTSWPEIWVMGSPRSPLGRTACIFTAARCPATTRSWATIQSTMSLW
jgi:D-alanyl-D-alanine carboxypeptidase